MRITRLVLPCAAIVLACQAGGPAVDSAAGREELMEADRAFARAVATGRLDAWVAAFADSGFQLQPDRPVERGRDAVRRIMLPAFNDDYFILEWEPTFAEISAGGDMGFTVGTYTGQQTAPDGEAASFSGKYLSIWQKNAEGEWKVVLDTGVPDTAPPE